MFKHRTDINLPDLPAEIIDGKRYYTTPDGNKYPSVTTVLGAASDQSWLDNWRLRVGEAEVLHISGQAARRGTAVHEIAEQYLQNNSSYTKSHMPCNIATFNTFKPLLDKHVGLIAGLELPLYSDKLRIAGRSDLICIWDGKLSIVDFKTSKREKTRDSILNYFQQESCYAYMFFERTGIPVPQLVTIMAIDDNPSLIFIEKTKDHIQTFIDLRAKVPF